jgi:hypothetical protein
MMWRVLVDWPSELAARDVVLVLADWRSAAPATTPGQGPAAAPRPAPHLPLADALPDGVRVVAESGRGRLKAWFEADAVALVLSESQASAEEEEEEEEEGGRAGGRRTGEMDPDLRRSADVDALAGEFPARDLDVIAAALEAYDGNKDLAGAALTASDALDDNEMLRELGRGLHSSTSQLNLSRF